MRMRSPGWCWRMPTACTGRCAGSAWTPPRPTRLRRRCSCVPGVVLRGSSSARSCPPGSTGLPSLRRSDGYRGEDPHRSSLNLRARTRPPRSPRQRIWVPRPARSITSSRRSWGGRSLSSRPTGARGRATRHRGSLHRPGGGGGRHPPGRVQEPSPSRAHAAARPPRALSGARGGLNRCARPPYLSVTAQAAWPCFSKYRWWYSSAG
jgi:hypothetical protein